ncbi:MAG: hypothetical protein ABFC89_01220 [Methanospirillum sp.]
MSEPAPVRFPGCVASAGPVRAGSPGPDGAAALLETLAAVEAGIQADRYRLPPATLEAIARLRTAGASIAGTAAGAGVSPHIVRDRLRRAGVPGYSWGERHRYVREVLEARGPELIAAYEEGALISALAADAGVSHTTIREYLVSRGIALRSDMRMPLPVFTARGPELIAAYESGGTIRGLAVDAGVSPDTFRRFLIAAGVALRHDPGWPRRRAGR